MNCNFALRMQTLFTFHYASTLSKPHAFTKSFMEQFTFHYASTLSGKMQGIFWRNDTNLHSTMLLLYPARSWGSTAEGAFTFHYASTLSKSFNPPKTISNIYIPLCFYFIFSRRVYLIDPWNLHSTMLLLYLDPEGVLAPCALNLHSTMLLLYREFHLQGLPTTIYLHSTMLLLYRLCTLTINGYEFNLHSTMLLLYHGETQITQSWVLDLHSTMLLLYRFSRRMGWNTDSIYIPLCHYASTLS